MGIVLTIFTLIIHLFPQKILKSIVLSFPGNDCNTQEKTETMVVQFLIIILFASFVLFRFFLRGRGYIGQSPSKISSPLNLN